ncbi:MAG: hypothetical protein Q8Q23_02650 [bacterium]|nr:hypothetical protein [bacterium]
MRLTINSNQLSQNIPHFMRHIGYTLIRDYRTGKESYSRRLTQNHYPRLHCYIFEQGGQVTFNLHLDQRPTRYEGQRAHAGEYDGSIINDELDRIHVNIIQQKAQRSSKETFEDVIGEKPKKQTSWWPFA